MSSFVEYTGNDFCLLLGKDFRSVLEVVHQLDEERKMLITDDTLAIIEPVSLTKGGSVLCVALVVSQEEPERQDGHWIWVTFSEEQWEECPAHHGRLSSTSTSGPRLRVQARRRGPLLCRRLCYVGPGHAQHLHPFAQLFDIGGIARQHCGDFSVGQFFGGLVFKGQHPGDHAFVHSVADSY
jgi:hypothetical protein